jgi:hypothetical protein
MFPSQEARSSTSRTGFSSVTAYPEDRRALGKAPVVYERNGGLLYKNPVAPQDEDILGSHRPAPGS